MKKTYKRIYPVILLIGIFLAGSNNLFAAEPKMSDYTSYPLFMANSVQPNILIMLDNSGSMNYNAYGTYPGDGGFVNDTFRGEPYNRFEIKRVIQGKDDGEERQTDGYSYYDSIDLDLGRDVGVDYPNQINGIRFQNVKIPKGAVIKRAYVEFTTYAVYGGAQETLELSISGEKSDSAKEFSSTSKNLSSRPKTVETADWALDPWDTVGEKHQTPDLKKIVQEIIDRDGWNDGNAMAFIFENISDAPASGRMATQYEAKPEDAALLFIEFEGMDPTRYYGYFNPDYFYYWNSNKFDHKYKKKAYVGDPSGTGYWLVEDLNGNPVELTDSQIGTGNSSTGLWDGNWMNWVSMRRIDVLRKVLMGGLATSRTGGGNQVNYGETPSQSYRTFIRQFDTSILPAVCPYDGNFFYGLSSGYIYVDDDAKPFDEFTERFSVNVQKDVRYEPEDFFNYDNGDNLSGVLQRYGEKARWGNEFFNTGTGTRESGGYIAATIGTNMTSLVTDLQNTHCNTWTPLAESFYVATQYFKQEDVEGGLDYPNGVVPNANDGQDPYYNGKEFVHCAKSFVLLLTDGASTMDSKIPSELKDYDGDGDETGCTEGDGKNCDYPSGGTDYLDDIALYARTTDLRDDLDGEQNLLLYTVYALADDPNARKLLMDASRNGAFEDINGDKKPNGEYTDPPEKRKEWDKTGPDGEPDGIPDTYFEATDGYKLEKELGRAIEDILRKAASGTAVSVISTSSEGEGNIVQAFFKPAMATETGEDTKWIGYLQSLWLDEKGNMREDTNQDSQLDISKDRIIKYVTRDNQTKIDIYPVSESEPYPNIYLTNPVDTVPLESVASIWEAGSSLSQKHPSDRKIFTYIDKNQDGKVDEGSEMDLFDDAGELVRFQTDIPELSPYLGVLDDTVWAGLGDTHENRCSNVIRFIRGYDDGFSGDPAFRKRNVNGNVWKLGDIVYSTPAVISHPIEFYDFIYGDESYYNYYRENKNRETVVYVGSNDGMIHAFTSWIYDRENSRYIKPAGTTESIGEEIWAFVPNSVLAHLKWLPSKDYTHVYYTDLKPKMFDAKILPDKNNDGEKDWGTFLLYGMNYGGRHIWAKGDYGDGIETRHTYPSYILLNVTDPRNPKLMWERTYSRHEKPPETADNDTDLGLTTSIPGILKVGEKWFAAFGSGPVDFEGNSDRYGHVFVVDLITGEPYRNGTNDWLFEGNDKLAFMGSPVSLDKNLNYNVDGIYIGETFDGNRGWEGAVYKVTIPWKCLSATCEEVAYGDTEMGEYTDNPLNWTMSKLFESPAPITASASLSIDHRDNAWLFFGTGRYLSELDKSDDQQQYLFGIKDPFFNKGLYNNGYYHNTQDTKTIKYSDLLDMDPYIVLEGGSVLQNGKVVTDGLKNLEAEVREKDGWYRTLAEPKERCLSKPTVVGGLVLAASFIPDDDICGFGGSSSLYGLYYVTGTSYSKSVFFNGLEPIDVNGTTHNKVVDKLDLGEGLASPSAVHIGKQEGNKIKIYTQKSTGEISDDEIEPPLKVRSRLKFWIEN